MKVNSKDHILLRVENLTGFPADFNWNKLPMSGDWMHYVRYSQLWRKACEEGTEQDRIAAMDALYRHQNQNKTPSDSQG